MSLKTKKNLCQRAFCLFKMVFFLIIMSTGERFGIRLNIKKIKKCKQKIVFVYVCVLGARAIWTTRAASPNGQNHPSPCL